MLGRAVTVLFRTLYIIEQRRDKFRQLVITLQILTREGRDQEARRARQVLIYAWYMRPSYHDCKCKYPC